MASFDGAIRWWEAQKEAAEVKGIVGLIADVEAAQHARVIREHEKEEDQWVAAAAVALDELDVQHRSIGELYAAATQKIKTARGEVFDEAKRLGIHSQRIDEYRINSLLLGRIGAIKGYASAVSFLKDVPAGVEEIGRAAYEAALEKGREISLERKKERGGKPFNDVITRAMIPVLLRCEYTEHGKYVERFFHALLNSFARKVLQDVKARLREIYPTFSDLVADMETKITVENVRDFLFAGDTTAGCLIAVAKAHVWSNDRKRNYAVLLERRVGEDELEVLDVASTGDGLDELSAYVGKIFRYKVHTVEGTLYPELRHLRDRCNLLYRFILKVLRGCGWEIPAQWPNIPYPW